MSSLKVKLLSVNATVPTRAHNGDVGYDLYAASECIIDAHGKALIETDIAVAIPEGHYGRIAPRSSMAWKNHTDVAAGVIDQGYRGPVKVAIFNHSNSSLNINKGDRVAQLILEKCSLLEIDVVTNLNETSRGEAGFGSTGQ